MSRYRQGAAYAAGVSIGCRQNLVLTQPDLAGEFNVMTLVEWSHESHFAAAKAVMQARYAQERFDPAAFMQQLGVQADLGTYRHV